MARHWIETGDAVPGILGTVVAERRTVRGDNPGGDPASLQLPPLHPEVQSFLAAPIASPAHVYGWICLVGNEGTAFTEDDEHLVMALSAQVGRIYENLAFSAAAVKRPKSSNTRSSSASRRSRPLRHERDRAQRYLDTAEVILLALDIEGRITLINRYALRRPRMDRRRVARARLDRDVRAGRMRDASERRFRSVLGGDLSIVESPMLTRSGEERLDRVAQHGCCGMTTGSVIGTLSSGTDITERHQAVEALRIAEERMRFALEAAASGSGTWTTPPGCSMVRDPRSPVRAAARHVWRDLRGVRRARSSRRSGSPCSRRSRRR